MGATGFMPVVARTRIGRYYRTTVPREVRKLLELRENDEIEWVFENGAIYIRKAQR
ncbi:MAG: AbrB/MazE/SpoVT family DNA-binding domain-containing protein [Nanopusillaceae archaeon]